MYFTRSRVVLMKNRCLSQQKRLGDRWGRPSRFTPATMDNKPTWSTVSITIKIQKQ